MLSVVVTFRRLLNSGAVSVKSLARAEVTGAPLTFCHGVPKLLTVVLTDDLGEAASEACTAEFTVVFVPEVEHAVRFLGGGHVQISYVIAPPQLQVNIALITPQGALQRFVGTAQPVGTGVCQGRLFFSDDCFDHMALAADGTWGVAWWGKRTERAAFVHFQVVKNAAGDVVGFGPIKDCPVFAASSELHDIKCVPTQQNTLLLLRPGQSVVIMDRTGEVLGQLGSCKPSMVPFGVAVEGNVWAVGYKKRNWHVVELYVAAAGTAAYRTISLGKAPNLDCVPDIHLSPNGQHLVTTFTNGTTVQVFVHTIAGMFLRTFLATHIMHKNMVFCGSDGDHVLFLTRVVSSSRLYTFTVYSIVTGTVVCVWQMDLHLDLRKTSLCVAGGKMYFTTLGKFVYVYI